MTQLQLSDRKAPRAPFKVFKPQRPIPAAGLFGWRKPDPKAKDDLNGGRGVP